MSPTRPGLIFESDFFPKRKVATIGIGREVALCKDVCAERRPLSPVHSLAIKGFVELTHGYTCLRGHETDQRMAEGRLGRI